MKDIQAILEACLTENEAGRPTALATVVKVEGSAYRRPGARMLICQNGSRIGSVSGGCLEADVAMHAQQVMTTGQSDYILYDTRISNGDLIAELGCKGAVGILIEPTANPEVLCSLQFLASFVKSRGQGAMATVFRVEGNSRITIGSRLMRSTQGTVYRSLEASDVSAPLFSDLDLVIHSGRAQTRTVPYPEGSAEVLLEPIQSPISLLLFGTGQDTVPLAQMARSLGWQITIVDHRPSLLTPERYPDSKTLLMSCPGVLEAFEISDLRTAAVIMSHNYLQDLAWLQSLLPTSWRYIGLLGPRKRAEQLLEDLHRDGIHLEAEHLSRLYSPTGLDIGSETPEEIAFAIIAEIQAVLNSRSGGFLRQRKDPIHSGSERTTDTAP